MLNIDMSNSSKGVPVIVTDQGVRKFGSTFASLHKLVPCFILHCLLLPTVDSSKFFF
jgi:hypothetical protein